MDISQHTGVIDEHAPRSAGGDDNGRAEYDPSPEERAAIKLAMKTFAYNRKGRAQHDRKWLDYYHMFRGKQWKSKRPSYRHSEVINFVFRAIQSLVPIQTDFRPRPEILPREPSDLEFATILKEVSQADWENNHWSEQLLEIIYDGNIIGTGISTTPYDEDADFGRGCIKYETLDPYYCYPDPEARDMHRRCDSFVTAEPRPVAKVKRKYPKVAEFIKADVSDIISGEKSDIKDMKFRSPIDNKTLFEGPEIPADDRMKDMVLLIEVWLRPEFFDNDPKNLEEKEVPILDPETGEPLKDAETGEVMTEFEQRRKWPNGRKIVIANGVLCEDGANPYDDGDLPFERYVNYLDSRQFWGISEVEQVEGPQKIFNKVFSFALDCLTLMGNPVWLNPLNSGVADEDLVNQPGLVIPHNPEAPPRRQEGTQLQPYVMNLAQMIEGWIEGGMGLNDITKGNKPEGVVAASAIQTLQDASHTRIRQKSKNLDRYLQQFGQHWLSRVMQYYDVARIVRITNQEDGVPKYFRMRIDTETYVDQDGSEQSRKVGIVEPFTENGKIDPDGLRRFEIAGKFDVRIATGSALPFAKAEKESKLLGLFDRGIIDSEEVLKQSDYPNYEAVMQRMAEKQAQAAEAEAKSQAQAQA